MKQLYSIMAFAILLCANSLIAQDKINTWSVEAGVNYVNVYSVGEDTPQGEFFDEYFNVNDHWNLGTYFAVTRKFTDRLSLTAKGSFNEISKWGEDGNDVSVFVDHIEYYGIDGMLNFKILTNTKLKPYIALGGGYTWIEEGTYNTYSLEEDDDDFVGAGTVNGALGVTYDITDRFGVNLQFAYKHSFKEYLTKHFQNSIGVYYNLGKTKKPEQIAEPIIETPIDTDGDGIIDDYDVCPTIKGIKEYAGCPDTDKDGVPDSLDKCVNVPGEISLQGCPLPDTDKDGVLDMDDNCPNKAGTVANNGCPDVPKPTTVELNTLNDYARTILFNSGKSSFKNETYEILQAMSSILNKYPEVDFSIEGYTDSVGNEESNRLLSVRRANAVRDYFISKGINAERLFAMGFGEDYPIDSNTTSTGRANNRRVEVKLRK